MYLGRVIGTVVSTTKDESLVGFKLLVVSKLNEEDFIKCDTFRYFDEVTIKNIVDVLISGADEFDKYEEIINKRKKVIADGYHGVG